MSYDICVFNKRIAPRRKEDFIKWYDHIMTLNGDSTFDDIHVASKELQEWYSFMLKHFPAMNGRDAEESQQCYAKAMGVDVDVAIDDSADYSIRNDLIYIAFGYSQAKNAIKLATWKAKELGLGVFDPQEGNFLLCNDCGQTSQAVQNQRAEKNSKTVSTKKKTIEKLIHKCDFKGARKICYHNIVTIAAFMVFWLVVFSMSITEASEPKSIIVPLESFLLCETVFGYPLYLSIKRLRKAKVAEETYNSIMRTKEESRLLEAPERLYAEIKRVLGPDCEVIPVEDGVCTNNLTDIYLAERESCKNNGMLPIILQLDCNLIVDLEMNLKEKWGETSDAEKELESMKIILYSRFNSQSDWNEFVGYKDDESRGCLDGIDDVDFMWGRFVIAKLPVTTPADVFTRVPIGDWGECPSPNVHRTLADYWNKKYGAVPCFISCDTIMYNVPKPVDEENAYHLAIEHAAYCADEPFTSGDTLGGMANQLKQSTFWHFMWSEE